MHRRALDATFPRCLDSPRMRSLRDWPALLLLNLVFGSLSAAAAERVPAAAAPSVTVQPGETWVSVRNRMFSLDELRKVNPGLDREMLHPGEVVRAPPYVSIVELEREQAARRATEHALAETRGRLANIEKDRAAIEGRLREAERAGSTLSKLRALTVALFLVGAALLGLLVLAVAAARAARRHAAETAVRARSLQSRYDELRLSLHEIDVKLQQRVIALLRLHGAQGISDRDVRATMAAMFELTETLRKKHDGLENPPNAA